MCVCVVALLYYSALCVSLLYCITNDYSPLLAHHCWLKTTDAQDDPNMELSLLDSFASDVDVKPSEEPPGIPAGGNRSASGFTLLDTFASDEAPEARPRSDVDPHQVVVDPASLRRAAEQTAPVSVPRVETRGRKKGSTAHALALERLLTPAAPAAAPEPGAPLTNSERASRAGQASARKRAENRAQSQAPQPSPVTGTIGAPCLALVPAADAAGADKPSSVYSDLSIQKAIVALPANSGGANQGKVEAGVLQGCLRLMSKAVLADKLKCSRQTITRRMRLLSFCSIMVRRCWNLQDIISLDRLLINHFGEAAVRRTNFINKYKSDEMSMRAKVWTSTGLEHAVVKLLQIIVSWTVVWKVRESYVRMRVRQPGLVKAIESCKVKVVRRALDSGCVCPDEAKLWETTTRIPIADMHPSNTGADETYARDYPEEAIHRFNCHAHIECRVGNRCLQTFPNEKRGLLHFTLAANFGGTLLNIKSEMKDVIKEGFSYYDNPDGAGPEAARFREQVFQVCCDPSETSAKKSRQTKTRIYHIRRVKLNGIYRRRGKVQHFCRNRWCCIDANDCLRQLDELIDSELGPDQWCVQRWTGIEDCIDWVLFWILCHDVLELAVIRLFDKNNKPVATIAVARRSRRRKQCL